MYMSSLNTQPFLFIGSGFSKRYLNTPSWDELLEHLAFLVKPLEDSPKLAYMQYYNKAEVNAKNKESKNELFSLIASYIENDFKNTFYNKNEFRNNHFTKQEIETILEENINPFKFYLCKYFANTTNNKLLLKNEINALIENKIKIAGIITTNYDLLLEKIFTDFTVYKDQLELLGSMSYQFSELYKIHGCCSKVDSIVFTNEDYRKVAQTNKYLAAKLLTIFVEFPIIFIGYSLNDENIRNIFQDISRCLTAEHRKKIRNKLFFISKAKENEGEYIDIKTERFGSHDFSFINITLHDYSKLYKSFNKIIPKYRVDLARKLFKEVSEIIITNEKNNKIFATALQDPNIKGDELACYIGSYQKLGMMRKGYLGISMSELYRDIIFDDLLILDTQILLKEVFPKLKSNNARSFFPIYKYKFHKNDQNIQFLESKKIKFIKQDVREVYSSWMKKELERKPNLKHFTSISDIKKATKNNQQKNFTYIIYSIYNLELPEVSEYITEILENNDTNLSKIEGSTEFKKLIAVYDYMKNK
ncbi:hypothetical protein [Mycolicibacterium phage J1]|nr:hypothetical protein [Mycolicibacterium phage J1]